MFAQNLRKRITAIIIQLTHADAQNISNVAKSSYYRAAAVLICTVVEGLVYYLVAKHSNRGIIGIRKELKQLHAIPSSVLKEGDIVLAKKITTDIHINDEGVNFQKLNQYLKKHSIISNSEFKKLQFVRTERNKLHVQGIKGPDVGYTKKKIQKLTEPMDFLTKKI